MESFKVFLSHSTRDAEFVRKLATELEHELISPWLCEVDIIPGDNFVSEIEQGLSSSDLAIVTWSPDAARSHWTDLEWASVLDREICESRRRLGVVLLRDAKLPELLRTKIWVDARADMEKGVSETVRWVKRMRDMRRDAGVKAANLFLDYEPRDFVGRAEHLEILYEAIAEQPGTMLLFGEAGSGKSTLALKFGWQFQGAFDAVIFQSCGQRSANDIGVELAARLKLNVGFSPPEKQLEAVRQWLRERRSLLVLDDIWNRDAIDLSPGPPSSVLVTSRHRSLSWVPAANTREVKSFSREESETVFRIHLGEETALRYREVLLQLADRFERLPIAVVVAAYVLRRELDPLDRAAPGLKIEQLCDGAHDVPALFQRAIQAQKPSARALLQAASVCAPAGFWLPLAGTIAGLKEEEIREVRNELVNFSLLRVLDRARQRFQIHALLREQLRKDAALAELANKHAVALEHLFEDWEERWQECLECLHEILPAMEFLWKAGLHARSDSLAFLASSTGKRVGELETALSILKREESLWSGRSDPEAQENLQRCFGNQAMILHTWGRLEEAAALLKKQESLCRTLNQKEGLLSCYCNQAGIIKEWGRLEEAMELLKKGEALCLELQNKEGLSASYGNQAVILLDWGRVPEALDLLRKQEALCLEREDKNGLQACYANLAFISKIQARPEEAMELHKKEEALCLEIGNKDGLQACYGAQGSLYYAADRLEEAMECFSRQESLCLELSNKRDLAACHGSQAMILSAWGRNEEAQRLLKEEEAICLSLDDKGGLSNCYGKQAQLERKHGNYREAQELLLKQEKLCLETRDQIGLGHCYWHLGQVACDRKNKEDAVKYLEQAKSVFAAMNLTRECASVDVELTSIKTATDSPPKSLRRKSNSSAARVARGPKKSHSSRKARKP
jgi:tetratricopeptide (TPR) repeat protein